MRSAEHFIIVAGTAHVYSNDQRAHCSLTARSPLPNNLLFRCVASRRVPIQPVPSVPKKAEHCEWRDRETVATKIVIVMVVLVSAVRVRTTTMCVIVGSAPTATKTLTTS